MWPDQNGNIDSSLRKRMECLIDGNNSLLELLCLVWYFENLKNKYFCKAKVIFIRLPREKMFLKNHIYNSIFNKKEIIFFFWFFISIQYSINYIWYICKLKNNLSGLISLRFILFNHGFLNFFSCSFSSYNFNKLYNSYECSISLKF